MLSTGRLLGDAAAQSSSLDEDKISRASQSPSRQQPKLNFESDEGDGDDQAPGPRQRIRKPAGDAAGPHYLPSVRSQINQG